MSAVQVYVHAMSFVFFFVVVNICIVCIYRNLNE